MAGRITKYSEPVPFHKTMGTRKLVIMNTKASSWMRNSMTSVLPALRRRESLMPGSTTGLQRLTNRRCQPRNAPTTKSSRMRLNSPCWTCNRFKATGTIQRFTWNW